MAKKKGTNPKNINRDEKKTPENNSKKNNISDVFLDELKGAFTNFDKFTESKRIELYGDKQYLEQFWDFFVKEYPNLLDKIEKKDLPTYIKSIEDKWFTLPNIKKNAGKLNEQFKSEDIEIHVMEKSLSQLQKFCEDKNNNLPDDIFKKFAADAWFTHDKLQISSDGKLKTVDNLYLVWKDFLKKEKINIEDIASETIEDILTPDYNPTERVMVAVAITKIKRELKGDLRAAFDVQFSLPITIFTSYQDLINFKTEWIQFLDDHASDIDQSLAKKLDSIIITNGDIQKEFSNLWRDSVDTKWFTKQQLNFRVIFNKLVTRQLFEEIKKTQEAIDDSIKAIGDTFREFPPYVNDILNIDTYRFNDKVISDIDSTYHTDIQHIDIQILDLNNQYTAADDIVKKELRKKIKILKQEREQRKWQAYIVFLRTKDTGLADVFTHLVTSKFNFSLLSVDHQQFLINVLIKNKLEDSIKNKIPELLAVTEEDLTQFVTDLFDLKKMDLVIPTRHGPVPLTFLKKEFLTSTRTQLPALNDLEDLKNLPLNFITQITESNAAFFEDSPIFDSIYTNFAAKNWKIKFNDAYKVKIKKNWKTVEWYLSSYSPIEEKNNEDYTGKELYLYSEPITAPNQERKLVTREWTDNGTPVVIKDIEQQKCDVRILDKKLNLNGDAFWALLFGYVLGQQSMAQTISPEKEKALAEKLGQLEVYKEKEEWEEELVEPVVAKVESKIEDSEQKKFENERNKLKWYGFPEEKYKNNWGFVVWSRLFMPFADSEVPPLESNGKARLQMEITHIDKAKWTFKVKLHGGELRLGTSEWASKELPMNASSIAGITKAFGKDIYKLPNTKWTRFEEQMNALTKWSVSSDLGKYFWSLKFNWSKFSHTLWNFSWKEITHFGLYEPKAIGETLDEESGRLILYKIKSNANGTITVSGDSTTGNYVKNFPSRDMDYTTFMLFIKEKWLQPKCKEQIQAIHAKDAETKSETPTTVRWFSINSVIGFFKNSANKLKDSIKKYDDELTEELTDLLTSQGQLWNSIWWFLSPFGRVASSFENMGMEAFLARDDRIWKKVEKRQKFYDDFDYTRIYNMYIKPMLDGTIKIVPHYKMAALLLVHLKKGKWPYAKDAPSTAKGNRIGALLWKDHQKRYLAIREKKIRELEENAHIYGGPWADQIKNELVELEMRYIVHVMDGRHMWINDWDKTKNYFQDKYSKKFCDELEWAYTWFFKQSTVEEWFTKNQDVNFEFARVEYFRQLADRPQQALPFLKVMATKAINPTQWKVFETAVMTWLLSGVFLNMTYASTQSFIQKICRTRGFIPWIFSKDLKQQSKMQRLLDLFSGNKFTSETWYSSEDYSYRNNKGPGPFIDKLVNSRKPGDGRFESPWRMTEISQFLALTWENVNGKTLLDIYSDPKLPISDKLLLEEYIKLTNEKNEGLDPEVQKNRSSLTWSILTKSQSVVSDMIKFDKWWFAGKDGDEIQNMRAFSENMQKAIPSDQLKSQETVKFFVSKFFNRFGERWFSWNRMTEFLKRLKWCKQHKWSSEVSDIMFYSVVWEIISSMAWHEATPPDELMWALGAWQTFFQNNIDNILQPDVISSCFGWSQYKANYEASDPKLESRETSSVLLDQTDYYMYSSTLNKEEKLLANAKKNTLTKNRDYLNKDLYLLADGLSKKCSWFNNRFRKPPEEPQKNITSTSTRSKATWAKIKNSDVTEKVRQILEGKQIDENNSDDYVPYIEEDDYY